MSQLRVLYDKIVFRAGPGIGMGKSDFVGNWTQSYVNDPEAFKREIRAAYKVFIPIMDINMDCKLDQNEFILMLKAFAYNSTLADLRYFDVYNISEGIPVVNMVDRYSQYFFNTTKVDDGSVDAYNNL